MTSRAVVLALSAIGYLGSATPAHADLPFLRHLAEDRELPRPHGIGIDIFHMEHEMDVASLDIDFGGITIDDPSIVSVNNVINYLDIKLDAWLFPFMNVFVVIGTLEGETKVDLGAISIPQLPVPLGKVNIDYDGNVYGGGFTLVTAKDQWFVSATTTYTDSNTDGDFSSSVKTLTFQPRIGMQLSKGQVWAGATYLDADETHVGIVDLGVAQIPPVPFDVGLSSKDNWNVNAGGRFEITPQLEATLELGFAEREHILANVTWRF